MGKGILTKVERYVSNLFNKKLPAENVYHSLEHTKSVVKVAKQISEFEKLTNLKKEIVEISAWFHDVGYLETSDGHEEISAKYAKDFLEEESYPSNNIEKIIQCILVTKLSYLPENLLEEILCDADIHYIGRKIFFEKSNLLRLEIEKKQNKKIDDLEWLNKNIEFLSSHIFFTNYAKVNFGKQKRKNFIKLKKRKSLVFIPT